VHGCGYRVIRTVITVAIRRLAQGEASINFISNKTYARAKMLSSGFQKNAHNSAHARMRWQS
jgi:hypothetical protein